MCRQLLVALVGLCVLYMVAGAPGGLSPVKAADQATLDLVNKIKSSFETKTGMTYAVFVPVKYREQVVNGVNYYVKVQTGLSTTSYAHIKIHEALPVYGGKATVLAYVEGLERDSDISAI